MGQRQAPVAEQRQRSQQLDALRTQRRLTREEADEAERLAHRAYMREWRAQQAERWGPPRRRLA